MDSEKGHIKLVALALALVVIVAAVAVVMVPHDVTVEKVGEGTVSVEGDRSIRAYESLSIEIEPSEGCTVTVYVDGTERRGPSSELLDVPVRRIMVEREGL